MQLKGKYEIERMVFVSLEQHGDHVSDGRVPVILFYEEATNEP